MRRWWTWLAVGVALLAVVAVVILMRAPAHVGSYRQVDDSQENLTLVFEVQLTKSGEYRMTETYSAEGLIEAEGDDPGAMLIDEGTYVIDGDSVRTTGTLGTFAWTLRDGILEKPGFRLEKVD